MLLQNPSRDTTHALQLDLARASMSRAWDRKWGCHHLMQGLATAAAVQQDLVITLAQRVEGHHALLLQRTTPQVIRSSRSVMQL